MTSNSFTLTLQTGKSEADVFNAISQISSWWSEECAGSATQLHDEFEVRFSDVHFSRQKLVEVVLNKKIVWLVTESHLSFLKNKNEWTGTRISFEIRAEGTGSVLTFIHDGLTPEVECYRDCSGGWRQYLQQSLLPFINTGEGAPNVLEDKIAEKANNNR